MTIVAPVETQAATKREAHPKVRTALGLLGSAGVGCTLAVQSRVNGVLGVHLHDGIAAAVVSFGGGLLVLLVITALTPRARRGFGRLVRTVRSESGLRVWQCVGGVCGAFLVFTQSIIAGVVGVALFTVGAVGGQLVSSLVVDRLGLGPATAQRLTPPRLIGAALALLALVLAMSGGIGAANVSWLVVLPAFAGMGVAWQQAMNGLVKQTADSAISAATLNFATGTTALLIVFVVHTLLSGFPDGWPAQPWLYIGGPLGIFVVGGSAVLVRYTGVLLLTIGIVSGQLLGALALDLAMPVPGSRVHLATIIGILLTLLAVGIASLGQGRAPEPARDLRR